MAVLHFNIIYNRSDATETEDSKLALKFVEFLVEKLEGWGFSGYYADRDAVPGRSIFDETFRIVQETEKTIVVITPDFRSNYWAKYSKQAAFKYLIDQAHQHKLIPIAVNIIDNKTLKELNVNEPLHINGKSEVEWENNNKNCFSRLRKAFVQPAACRVAEEIGDNRLRTEVNQQLVTRPASERSLSYTSSSSTDLSSNVTTPLTPDSQASIVIYERSIPEPGILSIQGHPLHSNNQPTCLEYDGTTSAKDTEGTDNQSVVEQKAPPGPEQKDNTGTNMDDDRIDTASMTDGQNGGISADAIFVSLSDDRDLSLDHDVGSQVTQNNGVGAPSSYLDPRPETLGAEGIHDAGLDIAKLSIESFEGDDSDENEGTVPKQLTHSPSIKNQTDDAKVSELDASGFHSGASLSPSKDSDLSAVSNPKETGTRDSMKSGIFALIQCLQHIDKAYPG